jgi:hypothetical protein
MNHLLLPAVPPWFILPEHLAGRFLLPGFSRLAWFLRPSRERKPEEGKSDWELLQGLYAEALRAATRWDEVLSDVERAIAKPGRIGVS